MKIRKSQVNTFFLSMLICWILLPVVSYYLGSTGYILLFMMWLITADIRTVFSSFNQGIFFIIWYIIMLVMQALGFFSYGKVDSVYFFSLTAFAVLPYFISNYYTCSNRLFIIERIKKIILVLSIITFISTIVVSFSHPDAPKTLAMGTEMDVYKELYVKMNCGGYGFVYGFVISCVPILSCRFNKKIWNVIRNIYIILGCITLIVSQYTIGLIIFSAEIILYIFAINNGYKWMVAVKVILVSVGLTAMLNMAKILNVMASLFQSYTTLAVRLSDLALFIQNGAMGNSVNSRMTVYAVSWEGFLRHPFFGGAIQGYSTIGAHSTILDLLALFGVLGTLFYFLFLIGVVKKVRNKYYSIAFFGYILISILNPTIYNITIGFGIYMTAVIFVNNNEEGNNENS